jgi:hypothetical protein
MFVERLSEGDLESRKVVFRRDSCLPYIDTWCVCTLFPMHPPYSNSLHFSSKESKYHRRSLPLQGPILRGSSQTEALARTNFLHSV